ncbi:MAG: hypothetical protein AB7I19_07230 [Planctomycetota bacterium]
MSSSKPSRVRARNIFAIALFGGITLIAARHWLQDSGPKFAHAAVEPNGEPSMGASESASRSAVERRRDVPFESKATTDTIPEVAITDFESAVDLLCALADRMRQHIAANRTELVRTLDREAEDLLILVGNQFANAGERALEHLARLSDSEADLRILDRRNVLVRVLRDDLVRRWRSAEQGGPSSGLDALVHAALGMIPTGPVLAKSLGADLLVGEPFLGTAHESAVLGLVEDARSESWLADIAGNLLRTLWQNLLARKERSRGAIESMAIAFLERVDGAARVAAIDVLIEEPTLREMLLERARRQADPSLAEAIASSAASKLDPGTALDVVRRLHACGRIELLPACMQLGLRDQAAVRLAYEEALGDLRDPGFRANLVAGLLMAPNAESLELLEIALREDPELEVRERALLQLTAMDDPSIGERAIESVLSDPRYANQADVVGLCVSALSNLARRADRATLERVASRLLRLPGMREPERARVKQLARIG